MKRGRKFLVALACGALMISTSLAWAQKNKKSAPAAAADQGGPKPKSQAEATAINAVIQAQTPDDRLKAIDNVLTKFSDTQYKPMLLVMAMQTAEQKNDFAQTTFYAEQVLESDPKNTFADVTMASETARHTREFDLDKEEKLKKAEKYAHDAIENAPNTPKPRPDITDEQWTATKKDLESQAHEALGMIAALRKKYDDSISEYKQSLEMAAQPDAGTYLRLGQTYLDAGKLDDANAAFDKAANMPNAAPAVKNIANAKKAEVAKLKAGGAAPSAATGSAPGAPAKQ